MKKGGIVFCRLRIFGVAHSRGKSFFEKVFGEHGRTRSNTVEKQKTNGAGSSKFFLKTKNNRKKRLTELGKNCKKLKKYSKNPVFYYKKRLKKPKNPPAIRKTN